METKLNFRLPQTADRQAALQTSIENELRRRIQLLGSSGILSADGKDVDNESAPCAIVVNSTDSTAIDVLAGTVVFATGEYVDVSSTDILAVAINTTVTDGQVVRLEYGEVEDGDLEANPYYNFAAKPKIRKKTPLEMLVIETVTAYNAQPSDVKTRSVVLGVARFFDSELTLDNGRDTYSFSRPWFSPIDTEHRSKLGTGVASDTNPHALSANDLSVGNYSMWQALVGRPAGVLARPTGFGRLPGSICSEVIPSGSFFTDATGLVTGKPGALYAYLGFWPHRLLFAQRVSNSAEVAAWIPAGRNVVAIWDPAVMPSSADLSVTYTKVTAGAMPGSTLGLSTVEFSDPAEHEIIVAGGNFFQTLSEKRAIFTDVGLVPMYFDVLVDGSGKVYKRPDVLYCNTKLDTIGAGSVPFTIQPKAPTRLRLAISNYNPGFTEVRLQITGVDEAGSIISEQVVWSGPLAVPGISYTAITGQTKFTTNVYASVTQMQAIVRNNDGPNTTVTVFAEYSPQRPETADDLLLATVWWNGSEVSANYANGNDVAIDRRLVTVGGGSKGLSAVESTLNQPMLVETVVAGLPGSLGEGWATIVEDFNDPMWLKYPQADATSTSTQPVELFNDGLGPARGYISRKVPWAANLTQGNMDAMFMRLIPSPKARVPSRPNAMTLTVTLYKTDGTTVTLNGSVSALATYPPFPVTFTGTVTSGTYYAMSVAMSSPTLLLDEYIQGFIFHVRA